MFINNSILLLLIAAFCDCHQSQLYSSSSVGGVKGGGVRTYGGVFHDSSGNNQAASHFVNTQNYHQPSFTPYQPFGYGWNFNQPSRTYGGYNNMPRQQFNHHTNNGASSTEGNNHQIGWANGFNPNPTFSVPNLFLPNFVPPHYFPGSFPFPNFGHFPSTPFGAHDNSDHYGHIHPNHGGAGSTTVVEGGGNRFPQRPAHGSHGTTDNSGNINTHRPVQGGNVYPQRPTHGVDGTSGHQGGDANLFHQTDRNQRPIHGSDGNVIRPQRPLTGNEGSQDGGGTFLHERPTHGMDGSSSLGGNLYPQRPIGTDQTQRPIQGGAGGSTTQGGTQGSTNNFGGSHSQDGGGSQFHDGGVHSLGGGGSHSQGGHSIGSGGIDHQRPVVDTNASNYPQRPIHGSDNRNINNLGGNLYPQKPVTGIDGSTAHGGQGGHFIYERPSHGSGGNQQRPSHGGDNIGSSSTNRNQGGGGDSQFQLPYPRYPNHPLPTDGAGSIDIRNQLAPTDSRIPGSQKPTLNFNRFPSNSFLNVNNNRRQWTDDDEMKWQATTKAPYFENKAPGLECTLPAAAVLGAQSAFKVSSFLPLNVPVGKPILSCNASEILQAQIRLDGKIYDCKGMDITLSCPTHGGTVDECRGETLECDVNMGNSLNSVTCTNGTLISNAHIVCESANVMPGKSILNCVFKDPVISNRSPFESTTRAPLYISTRRPLIVSPVLVLPITPAPVSENFDEASLENRGQLKESGSLMPQVKQAMENVFPHDLFVMPSTMYLPQEEKLESPISPDLKRHVDGIFPTNLLAMSQTKASDSEGRSSGSSPRLSGNEQSSHWRNQESTRWDLNTNTKTPGAGTKTKISQRFGDAENIPRDRHEGLVFTD